MDSTIKKVGDSPANKVIPESSVVENATNTVEAGAERVILELPMGGSDCDKCGHIEQEFKVLKGSIKKLIVDIREQMNASDNPFLNIQQMMPAQSAIFREDPPQMERPAKPVEEPEIPALEEETEVPKKKDRASNPAARDAENLNNDDDRCPYADRHDRANKRCALEEERSGQGNTCPVMQQLYGPRDHSASGLCNECIRRGYPPERNTSRCIRPECPANLNSTLPCGRFVDRGYDARYQVQPLPCMPQRADVPANPAYGPGNGLFMQGPCYRCPQQGQPQAYGRQPENYDYYTSHEPCRGDYPPYYRQDYPGQDRYRQAPPEYRHEYDDSRGYDEEWSRNTAPREDAREQRRYRPAQRQQPHGTHRPAVDQPEYIDQEPEYEYREAPVQGRPARMQGKSRRRSLESAYDDSYVQPEPDPVVIDIPVPGSVRKKRKAHARPAPEIVVVDVEPENVVPQSIRMSRRKGL